LAGGRAFDRPAVYEVRLKGRLDAAWANYWFEGFAVVPLPNGESLLTGQVADQSALLGLLARMRDLGLPLLSVRRVGHGETSEEDVYDGKDNG
jgi:hypothetical protein